MPLKIDDPGDDVTIVARWDRGFTWMAHPHTRMRRASHALETDDGVWLVDPLDADGLDEALASLGTVAGVVVLTNSHARHADWLATRHDVSIHVPACFDADASPVAAVDAPVEFVDGELAATGFELVWEKDRGGWSEGALYHPGRRTLVVADALMTSLFTGREGRLEVLPFFRRSPPRAALGDLAVDRVLVGHGEPVLADAETALADALDGAGSAMPVAIARALPTLARQAYAALRS